MRYLTGFTGSHALALVVARRRTATRGGHRFFTDFRYETQSAEQVPDAFEREIVAASCSTPLAASARRRAAGGSASTRRA